MPGKFELKKAKNDKVFFNLLAPNGEVILTSQMYASKATAKKGIRSVQNNCGAEKCYVHKKGKSGKAHFVLRSTNNRVIGSSQTYNSPASLKNGIKSVSKNGKVTTIADLC